MIFLKNSGFFNMIPFNKAKIFLYLTNCVNTYTKKENVRMCVNKLTCLDLSPISIYHDINNL